MIGRRQRRQEKAERRARTKRHHADQAAEADDEHRRTPGGDEGRGRSGVEVIVDGRHCLTRQRLEREKRRSIMASPATPKRNLGPFGPLRAWLARCRTHGFARSIAPDYGFRRMSAAPMSLFCADAFVSPLEIEAAVTRALAEDLGRAGDITSIATVPDQTRGHAVVVARKAGVVSGLPLVAAAFRRLAP